jgi:hypothetical protein
MKGLPEPEADRKQQKKTRNGTGPLRVKFRFEINLLHFLDPDVTEAHVLSVLLKLERLITSTVLNTTIGMLNGDIVMNLDPIPPKGEAGRLLHLIALPVAGFENEVK